MALHQDDIIKLDLNRTGFHRSFLNHTIGKNDTCANRMGVELYRGNEPVDLSNATCEGFFLSPAGEHIVISGDYANTSLNVAYVDLPQACYNYEGPFTLAIKVIGGGVTGTIRMIDGQIVNTFTDGAVAPVGSVPSYQEVLAVYDQMVEALDTVELYDGRDNAFRNAESVPYTLLNKKFIDYRDGSLASYDDPTFYATDYIAVIGGKKIVVADYRPTSQTADLAGFAFYTSGGAFISGVQYQEPNEPIEMTIPASAAYMRATWFSNTGKDLKIVMQNYTAAEISLRGGIVINSTPSAPYDDANTIPVGTVVTYITNMPANIPSGLDGIVTIITANYHTTTLGGTVQMLFDKNTSWFRIATTESAYQPWVGNNIHTESAFSLFQTVGVIGDSYASGALTLSSYSGNDHYPISWPQIVARKNGITVTNFSKGGLTTKTWLTDDHGLSLLNSESEKDLYICALGINDNASGGASYLGVESDIGTDNDTFYGNYAKIISAIQTKAPNGKIVLSTMAPTAPGSYVAQYNEAIVKIAAHFQIPCMIQGEDPFFNSPQYYNNVRYNHPMAGGYVHMANAFDRMLCRVMDENVNYFANYGVNK